MAGPPYYLEVSQLSLFTILVKATALRSAAAAAAEALVALASLVMAVPTLRTEVFTHIIACDGVSALLTALSAGPSEVGSFMYRYVTFSC